jgi:TonB-linked SusC/RagA family outer membrane protein
MRGKLRFWLCAFILFAIGIMNAYGQNRTVSGTITDSKNVPIAGVSVFIPGTTTGTISDENGNYSINATEGSVLHFSFIGLKDKEVTVGKQTVINVTMEDESTVLDELVVVGYGTQKKANLTGSVDQVTSDVFEGRPSANVTQMLQGAIPNLNLKLTDGKPIRSATYNIRGTTSIGQGGSALVLIDGVEGDPSLLNPNDIESVSVLKDAASSSIYGSRAPYGVVLITTKEAKEGRVTVNYSTNLSIMKQTNTNDYVSDGYTWAEHFYTAYYNFNESVPSGINKTQQFSTAWLAEYQRRAEAGNYGVEVSDGSWGTTAGRWVYFTKGTDYLDALYKDHVFAQTHNISVSGSDDKFDFYLSGRYYGYDGLFDSETNTDKYKMMNGRLKVGYKVFDWLKISDNFDISHDNYNNPLTYSEGNGNIWRNIFDEGHPSSPIWNPDGTMSYCAVYSVGDFLYGNSHLKRVNDKFRNTLTAKLNFLDNKLRFNADFTYRYLTRNNTTKRVRTPYSRYQGVIETISGTQSYIRESTTRSSYIASNIYGEYEDTIFDKHYFKVMLGYNYEQSKSKGLSAYNDQLLSESVDNINLALGLDNRNITGSWTKWRSAGIFGRLNYVFDERYLLEFNARYDGSSKFVEGSQWQMFESVSAGWRVSQEPWFKVDKNYVSNLKLRASYGSLGNSNISAYSFDESFSISNGRNINGKIVKTTSSPDPIPNNLTWETAKTFDVGIDLGLFKERLEIVADWYNRKTTDMYVQGPTLPDVYGADSPKGNYGEMTTKGYEISVTWRDQFNLGGKPFSYSIRGTLADYKSKIDKYFNTTKSLGTYNVPNYYEGMTIGEIWGFVSNGLWQNQSDIDAAVAKANAAGQSYYNPLMQNTKTYTLYPGDIKFEDLNGNGYIDRGSNTKDDPGDRKIIGNSEPRYIYSFSLSAEWNSIYFNAFFQGVGKQDWYPSNEAAEFWGQYNRPYAQLPTWHLDNYWTEDNTDAYLPRYTGYYRPFFSGNHNANTRYLQDVSYLRLKNLQIGYNLPEKWIKHVKLRKASIFFSGENLFCWSPCYKYSRNIDVANIYGTDVDATSSGDGYNYPTMKSYSLGLNITF